MSQTKQYNTIASNDRDATKTAALCSLTKNKNKPCLSKKNKMAVILVRNYLFKFLGICFPKLFALR
jgi:hypothetical protein